MQGKDRELDGRNRAIQVAPVRKTEKPKKPFRKRLGLSAVALLVFPILWVLTITKMMHVQFFWVFVVMSAITFIAYGMDKLAAWLGNRRTPEIWLHLFALLGGWPGALLAQQVFHHKSSKRSFQVAFWGLVVINCIVLWSLMTIKGAH